MPRKAPGAERARRLLALTGRLVPGARISIAELAAAVGTTQAELADDLDTLSMCGVAPYDPGDLTPIYIEDGYVEVWGDLPAIRGPVRLSASEAGALAAALQAAGFSDTDGLTSTLLDAAASASFDATELAHTIRTATAQHDAAVYEVLAAALRDHTVVEIEYAKAGTEEVTARAVEPLSLFAERGAWYLTAWCRRAADWRTFRVDRIRAATATATGFKEGTHGAVARGAVAFEVEGLPTAMLRFASHEPFIEREWPGAILVDNAEDDSALVQVPFAGLEWIARHVAARLGSVEVLDPPALRAEVVRLAGEYAT